MNRGAGIRLPATEAVGVTASVGRAVAFRDAERAVDGSLKYLTDLSFPGMLHGKVVRSPTPHGILHGVDTSAALRAEGVVKVLTATDVPYNLCGALIEDWPVLASDRVRQVGDAIALVAALTPKAAEAAAALVKPHIEEVQVVDSPEFALRPEAPHLHDGGNLLYELAHEKADVEAALESADVVIRRTVRTGAQEHVCLEPGGGVGIFERGQLTVYCGTQNPARQQQEVARALRVDSRDVRIISTPMGGAFGSKSDGPLPIFLALLAWATGKPVRISLTREEVMLAGAKRHPFRVQTRVGFSRNGEILAVDTEALVDTGPYASVGPAVLKVAAEMSTGPYRVPAARFHGRVAYTNNSNCGAFRGYGVPQVAFALETAMDEAAVRLALDPVDIRRANVLEGGDEHGLYGHVVTGSLKARECLEAVAAHPLWQERRKKHVTDRQGPWRTGTGLALAIKGVGKGSGSGDSAGARLAIGTDGSIRIWAGPNHSGQSIETVYAQIAAALLGRRYEEIEVVTGDTEMVPASGPCAASRSTYAGGSAVRLACEEFLRRVRALGLDDPIDWAEAGRRLASRGQALVEVTFELPDVQELGRLAPELVAKLSPHLVYGSSAQLALVEVNERTGEVRVKSVVCAVDCGVAINPAGVIGQAEGGMAQGMGFGLLEELSLSRGILQTRSLETYLIPTSEDAPHMETILVEEGEATGPFGAKGMAEVVVVPTAPAVAAAIRDAVGVDVRELPATPERIYTLMTGRSS